MKYKVGDKVRIKSREWYESNRTKRGEYVVDGLAFVDGMKEYCGKEATITYADEDDETYRLDIDAFYWFNDGMFEDSPSDNAEKSTISEGLVKDIAEVIKKYNLGVSVSENDGKVIIEPLKEEEDLKKGTHVMVTNDINNEAWTLRQYLSNGYCDAFRTDSSHLPPMKFRFIIAFDKFNPNDIEESLKYNIVK